MLEKDLTFIIRDHILSCYYKSVIRQLRSTIFFIIKLSALQ